MTKLPSLLDQLQEASEPSSGVTGTGSVHRVPAHLDVLSLLADIDKTLALGLRSVGYRSRLDLHPRGDLIRMWASHAGEWRAVHPEYLYDSIGVVRRWVTRANNILMPDPQQIETRAQPCPSCDERRTPYRGAGRPESSKPPNDVFEDTEIGPPPTSTWRSTAALYSRIMNPHLEYLSEELQVEGGSGFWPFASGTVAQSAALVYQRLNRGITSSPRRRCMAARSHSFSTDAQAVHRLTFIDPTILTLCG